MKNQPTELTFEGLGKVLKASSSDSKVLKALDVIAGSLLVLSPVLGAPAALTLIGAKNEVVKAGDFLVSKLAGRDPTDELTRDDLLLSVYYLTCYTAFFEAVDRMLPDLKERLGLLPSDQLTLTTKALEAVGEPPDDIPALARHRIAIPHPNSSLDEHAERLDRLYEQMAKGFSRLLLDFAAWEAADETTRDHVLAAVRELPALAKKLYRGQYLALSSKFHEFAVWANLREHALTRHAVERMAADTRTALELMSMRRAPNAIDIGLADITKALARAEPARNLDEVLSDLGRAYRAGIDEPVIDDRYSSDDGVDLTYPLKSEIFVPQAFRALRCDKPGLALENEASWDGRPVQQDIGGYVLTHLASPYSLETPLVVLGQPGSGKSLLTEVLAGRLASEEYHPVRVVLRDINPDSDIQQQIQEQIRTQTGRDANWVELVARCAGRPPLVVLDGYDELLQASGKVFGTYLVKVADFQKRERLMGRPVRVIVTSRVTLIDKAEVPPGSTVVRLEEFDARRRQAWIRIWNRTNALYFAAHDVMPFALPPDEDVQALAGQPLLLLMLALYDSDANRLARHESLDQTALYHSLLRRFIDRERGKGEQGREYRALSTTGREQLVHNDLTRLGVAAIGMVNRRSLHITKADLDRDLEYYGLLRPGATGSGVPLGQAELLLGSFFFVHESRSRIRTGSGGQPDDRSAFEFLHNTFGEFLAADWLVTTVLTETETIRKLQSDNLLRSLLPQHLATLSPRWFATLMATPLFSRPVVLSMVREWSRTRLAEQGRTVDEFAADLETIFYSQLKRILSDDELPAMLLGAEDTPYPRNAALTNLATYTLNLVLLRCAIGGDFRVDLEQLRSDAFPKPWSHVVHLWQAGLTHDSLLNASTVLTSTVDDSGVTFTAFGTPARRVSDERLWNLYYTSGAIGDDMTRALSGWALQDASPAVPPPLEPLATLPAITDTWLQAEIRHRAALRDHALRGGTLLPDDQGLPTTSSTIAKMVHERGTDLSDSDLLRISSDTPELSLVLPEGFHTINVTAIIDERLYRENSAFTARLIAHAADGPRSPQRQTKTHKFANRVAGAALASAPANTDSLSNEVLYELIAANPRHTVLYSAMDRLLGPEAEVPAILSRSPSTVRRLLDLSTQRKQFDWVLKILRRFRTAPADLVRKFGPLNTLALLKCATDHLSRRDLGRGPQAHLDCAALIDQAFELATASEYRAVVEQSVRLLASAPRQWLSPTNPQVMAVTYRILEGTTALGDDISVAANADQSVLREKQRNALQVKQARSRARDKPNPAE